MSKEIERKFLVKESGYKTQKNCSNYKQGYLSVDKNRTVRVRIAGEYGYITIKGKSFEITRDEYEYQIPLQEATDIIEHLCLKPIIEKLRYKYVAEDGHIWEIDEFKGENQGLIIAEIELAEEGEQFSIPTWIDKEVTGDLRYYNSNLVSNPYNKWARKAY